MRTRRPRTLLIVALLGAAALLCAMALTATPAVVQTAAVQTKEPAARAPIMATVLEPGGSFAPMLSRVIPAVVTIRVLGRKLRPVAIPRRLKNGRRPPLPKPETEEFGAGGSGVIIDARRGYILTNNHVIEDAVQIEVGLSTGRRMPAKLVGTDIGSDVAVVKVEEGGLPALELGNSDAMRVGDIVAAVGNPFGLEGTATLGIISAVMRSEVGHGAFEDFLQIDAPINPGNSGGALVNVRGELIGINTVSGGGRGRSVGIGFAVPINMAKVIMDELIASGRMRRGSIGLIVDDLPMALASPRDGSVVRGAVIRKVVASSPAAAAGVEPGAIVVSAGDRPVRNAAEFVTRTATVPLGSPISLTLLVGGQERSVSLVSADIVIAPQETALSAEAGSLAGSIVGDILLGNRLYGDVTGAQVLRVAARSPAYWIGLEPVDVITAIDDNPVRSAEQLVYRLGHAGSDIRVAILRNGVPGLIRAKR
jgi:S1-C subfamily serine protease